MAPDDCTLVRNVLNGDKRSFDDLAERYIGAVFQLVYRFFNKRSQAEDIVQDILLQAYQSLGTYSRERPFISWLRTIAVRRCYREIRLHSQRAESDLPELNRAEQDGLDYYCLHAGSRFPDPEKALLARDLSARILETLPAREQMVLILRDVEGLSIKETARTMGISQIHVRVSSHRARKNAQQAMAAMAHEPEMLPRSQEQ